MSNEIATRDEGSLAGRVAEARHAHTLAVSFVKTSYGKGLSDLEASARILAGQELGLAPIASLRAFDTIQGEPTLKANTMRALALRAGHEIELVESGPRKVVMRGRRKGAETWQVVEWTIERAQQMGLTGKDNWKKQPQAMLEARATANICRLIAADVLLAAPFAAEEAEDRPTVPVQAKVTAAEYLDGPADPVEPVTVVDTGTGEIQDVEVEDPPGWEQDR